jgi:hypothetical protein
MMARKPPALPDVFARPGAAPSRGTAIEDLPQPAPEPKREPEPAAIAPPPPPPPAAKLPEPPIEEPYRPPVATKPTPPRFARRAYAVAVIALAVSLTAPFWEDAVVSVLGIRTPVGRAAEQSTLAVLRQDRRTEDIAQRLGTAMAQMTKQQAEFTAAMQRAERSATLIRTMALVRLSDTLRRPLPFAAELAVVQASGTDLGDLKPLLDQIEPYADTGIAGTTQLRQDFRTLYDQIARGGSSSWLNSLASWTHLRSSSQTPATPDPSLELLKTALARLADTDVAGALEATRQINDDYKPAFANWVDDAKARVAADTLAERVSDMVTQALLPPSAK